MDSQIVAGTPMEKFFNNRNHRAIVIGVGGVGSWLATFLASSNLFDLLLIDNDKIGHTDILRTPYRTDEIGEYKVYALAKKLYSVSDRIIVPYPKRVQDFSEEYSMQILKMGNEIELGKLTVMCITVDNQDTYDYIIKESVFHNIPKIRANSDGLVFQISSKAERMKREKLWGEVENQTYRYRTPLVILPAALAYLAVLGLLPSEITGSVNYQRKILNLIIENEEDKDEIIAKFTPFTERLLT